jgi:TP901 family phage tail tape measure protein
MTAPGLEFEQSMADLSAITGIVGNDLESLGETARKVGKASGVGASGAVEAYKLLASQIDVAKIGMNGLNELQSKTITLAQASGMGMADAANSLAGTINQFGLSANQAGRVINVLAAGAKYGAAEIPELAQSFKVAGASANAAGVSVESAAGALEALSKMNLKGAEAGTALRNVLLKMQTELGVDFRVTKLSDALAALQPKMQDAAYMAKIFGVENMAAAQFLAGNSDLVEELTGKVTGTSVAYEQAAIRTGTVAHKLQVLGAWFKDVGISVFEATKPFLSYAAALAQTMSGVMQAIPIISGIKGMFGSLAASLYVTKLAEDGVTVASKKFVLWEYAKTAALNASAAAQWLYNGAAAVGGAVMAFLKNRVDAVRNAMAAGTLGTLVMSGAMGIATAAAGAFSTALKAIGKAIKSIPVIGWVAAIVGLLISLFAILWQKSEWFRGLMGGTWGALKAIFHNVGVFLGNVWENLIKPVFDAIGEVTNWLVEHVFKPLGGFFAGVWASIGSGVQWLGDLFTSMWDKIGGLFVKILFWPFTLLMKLFPNLGAWLETKVWEPIKAVFEKIANRIGKLIEPIKKIWNKLFKDEAYTDVAQAYSEGSEKGKANWRKEQEKKKNKRQSTSAADLLESLTGENPVINLDTPSNHTTSVINKTDSSLSLGIPQNYNPASTYAAIASKLGNNGKDTSDKQTETPVKSIASRVDEISGSLKKIAATVAIPVALTVGAASAATAPVATTNNLYRQVSETAISYENSTTIIADNSREVSTRITHTANNQGQTVYIDRFTDKIEIHVSGQDAPKLAADRVRDEVEKALSEIFNV